MGHLKRPLSASNSRVNKFLESWQWIISAGKTLCHVFQIAGSVGQLISMQSAVGLLVRLMTCYLYSYVLTGAGWEAPVMGKF